MSPHFHMEKFGQYAIKASFGVFCIIDKSTPRFEGCIKGTFFKAPDQIVRPYILNVYLTHEKSVVLVFLEKLGNDVFSHFLEDQECHRFFGSLDIDELFEPPLDGQCLLSVHQLLEAP
jgi:hypothetical protein